MSKDKPLSDYEVGYRKPPKHTRFQPGQSGNAKGRPSGARSVRTDLEMELQTKVQVTGENGKPTRFTKQQIVVKSLITRAAKGDVRAAAQVFDLIAKTYGLSPLPQDLELAISDEDEAILADYIARQKAGEEADDA